MDTRDWARQTVGVPFIGPSSLDEADGPEKARRQRRFGSTSWDPGERRETEAVSFGKRQSMRSGSNLLSLWEMGSHFEVVSTHFWQVEVWDSKRLGSIGTSG